MAKAIKLSNSELVSQHIQALDAPLAEVVSYLRTVILQTDREIGEQIKWNSPSFYYTGDMAPFDPKEYRRDILVVNLHRVKILLVMPTGEKVKDASKILEGKYTDGRRIITIKDMDDAKVKTTELQKVLKAWLALVEK
ncbi:MAG: DUF1801 domain-containing protein [Sphingobacteriales bacterium]|nr:MAG: DUF1801 domain-containing protein [Sphingobacteriales bacterium]